MRVTAEAPCTVGNFGPGFDVLSLALARRGDRVTLGPAESDLVTVSGPGAERVPTEWARNSACATLDALRRHAGIPQPLHLHIEKGMPPGSGLGSSATSNAAAAKAFARLHELRLAARDALAAAAAGEAVATGAAHHDDVAAALFGGLTLVGGEEDPVVRLRPPPLHLVVARPEVDLPTREMRRLIPDALPKRDIVRNLGNVARIVHACHTQDATMLCRALDDAISRPYRAPKVPHFDDARAAAVAAGAQGFILSGSGPAMIAAMPVSTDPTPVLRALESVFRKGDVPAEVFLTQPAPEVNDPEILLH